MDAVRRDDHIRLAELMAADLCEAGTLLARHLHLPDAVAVVRGQPLERWDGREVRGQAAGEEISRPLRIVHVSHDFVGIVRARDREAAIAALERRRGPGIKVGFLHGHSTRVAELAATAWRSLPEEPRRIFTQNGRRSLPRYKASGGCRPTRPRSPPSTSRAAGDGGRLAARADRSTGLCGRRERRPKRPRSARAQGVRSRS